MVRPASAPQPGSAAGGLGPLLAVRGLALVTDHALKWLAIGLGKRLVEAGDVSLVLTIGLVGLSLPYVLFSWLAGALADRHPKTTVIRWCKAAELLIALAAAAVLAFGVGSGATWFGLPTGLWLLLATVIAIGTQAALMTPAVVGAIPEVVPPARLAAANGLFALVSLVCVLAGTAAGNWVADATPLEPSASAWARAWPTAALLGGAAVAGLVAAVFLPRLAAADPDAPPAWTALPRAWTDLGVLLRRPELAAAAAGIVFFWAIGAVAQANVDQFGTEAGATSQGRIVPLLVALVAGIGAGSVVTGRLASRPTNADPRVDLGFVPLGGLIMTVAFAALALTGGRFLAGDAALPWGPLVWLVVLGFGAGMFDVPLETYLQEKSPADRLGGVLAATNLLLFSGMFLASLAYGGLRAPWGEGGAPLLSARAIFAIFALLSLAAVGAAVWCAPRATLRLFVASIVRAIWKFRARGLERIPPTGPVVLVANHLSWLDGFLLPMASPRPVRMVVYGPNIKGEFLRMLADQWRFILFDPRPKSIGTALKTIQGGLADGDAIGIFCEGGISRTGQILGFKRGLEWLLEKVQSPLQPVSIDGLWGSGLTFSEGRYFTKWPRLWRRPVTLTFGPPLPAGTHPDLARLAIQEVTAQAVRRRMADRRGNGRAGDEAAWMATAEAFDGCCLVRRADRLLASLAADDPLHESLGMHGGRLLGIHAATLAAATPAAEIVSWLAAERSSLWLARIDQVAAAAGLTAPPALPALEVVVMPIGATADLPAARAAADAFQAVFGIAPVVAYAPPEAGGLVAMNTPPKRIVWDHEVITKPDTVGRVVNGVVVWPHAADREPLGLEPLTAQGIGSGERRTLVIGATLPWPAGEWKTAAPRGVLLVDACDVDKDGFLIPQG
jgi:acyl-[acyl-carrier-protein]-phospholipid O-acyltransferase/long-chain-fatty-acid--[acyl-carrier-protein] ligase